MRYRHQRRNLEYEVLCEKQCQKGSDKTLLQASKTGPRIQENHDGILQPI